MEPGASSKVVAKKMSGQLAFEERVTSWSWIQR